MVLQFNVRTFTKAKHISHISNDFILTNPSAKISEIQDDELGYSYFQFQNFFFKVRTTKRMLRPLSES